MAKKALINDGCDACGKCILVCEKEALTNNLGVIEVDIELCTGCGKCVKECPHKPKEIELVELATLLERLDFDMAL